MKTYIGKRHGGICEVWICGRDPHSGRDIASRELPLYLHIRNHSPTGFEWGYGGSGPAQLALAILVDHFTVDRGDGAPFTNVEAAEFLHQKFKFKVVGRFPQAGWTLTTEEINAAIEQIRGEGKEERA